MTPRPLPPWTGAADALRRNLVGLPAGLAALADEAVDHLAAVLAEQPTATVAAVVVPAAVHRRFRTGAPPEGLLAAAAATYLAYDVLDDMMDGDRPAFWTERSPGDVVLATQLLLTRADRVLVQGVPDVVAERLRALYLSMLTQTFEGQLRTSRPLDADTSPAEVAATISDRSGAMLAGLAAMAAVAAGAPEPQVEAAGRYGHELGVARQHVNDLGELLSDRTSDLRNGTATMAAAMALQPLAPAERTILVAALRDAADDLDARRRLIAAHLATAVADVSFLVRLHLRQAQQEADLLPEPPVGHDDLRHLVEHTKALLPGSSGSGNGIAPGGTHAR